MTKQHPTKEQVAAALKGLRGWPAAGPRNSMNIVSSWALQNSVPLGYACVEIIAAALASAELDAERLDFVEANIGRIERMTPCPPSTLWKWFIFPKRYDPGLSLNSLRVAIDEAMAAQRKDQQS